MTTPNILSDMDSLDYEDKHYQRRKTHLENRLYKTYDKIDEAEKQLVSTKAKKRFWDNDTQNETVCSLVHTKNSEIEITTKRGL